MNRTAMSCVGGGFALLALSLTPVYAQVASPKAISPDLKQFNERVQPFLGKHCLECHGESEPKGDLRLDQLSTNFDDATARDRWLLALKRVQSGEMPPKDLTRPTDKEKQTFADWINGQATAAAARRAAEGRVVLRRLNRTEYENTVRDLLGIEVQLKEQLPQDGSADGFDNVGAALHTSSFLMEKYLEATDSALNIAIANRPKPPPLIKKRYSLKESHQVKSTTESVYRIKDDVVVCFSSSARIITMFGRLDKSAENTVE